MNSGGLRCRRNPGLYALICNGCSAPIGRLPLYPSALHSWVHAPWIETFEKTVSRYWRCIYPLPYHLLNSLLTICLAFILCGCDKSDLEYVGRYFRQVDILGKHRAIACKALGHLKTLAPVWGLGKPDWYCEITTIIYRDSILRKVKGFLYYRAVLFKALREY